MTENYDWSAFMEKCFEDFVAEDRCHYNIILSDSMPPDRIEIITKDDRREIINIGEPE